MVLWVNNSHANVRLTESAEDYNVIVNTGLAEGFRFNGEVTANDALQNPDAGRRINFTSVNGSFSLYD
jgi:hypothetical protein